ncbi:MAG: hypothetical protein JSV98_10320 [candidate division WOR-3 bacterium]|nr:MAG: hypothetical protein JSV98_10320 [candidate division WOR-3 bacterium]
MIKHTMLLLLSVCCFLPEALTGSSFAYSEDSKEIQAKGTLPELDYYPQICESNEQVISFWRDLGASNFRQDTGQVDYRRYDIEVYLVPEDHFLTGNAEVVFRSKIAQLHEVNFVMFNDSLDIACVTHGSDTLGFFYDPVTWVLQVYLNDTLSVGQEDSIRIHYSGYVTSQLSQSLWNFCRIDSVIGYCTYFPYVWYPMPYDQNGVHRWVRWASGRVSLTVPQGWTAVSNGALLDSSYTDSTRTYVWGSDKTVVEFIFATAPYQVVEWQQSGVDFQYYDFDTAGCQSLMSTAGSIFNFYTNTFCSYPFDKMALVDILEPNIGYGAYTIVASDMPASLGMLGHEIAHQWWAHIVSQRFTDEDWISESFADFSTHLFREDTFGVSSMITSLQVVASYYLTVPPGMDLPVIPSPSNSMYYGAIMYGKGVWVLHMLRGVIGDTAFFDVLQTFANVYTDSSATAEMFQNVAEGVSGQDLGWFFDEWLFRSGYPGYVTYNYYRTNPDSNSVIINLHQSPSVGDLFTMPLTVACNTSAGLHDTTFWDSLEWHQIILSDTIPVLSVVVDPEHWVLSIHIDSLPRLRSIVPGNQQLTLFWNQYHDNPLPAGYNLYRSLSMNGTYQRVNQNLITDTSCVDTTLTNGVTYYYKVKAVSSIDTCYETKFSNMLWNTPQGIDAGTDTAFVAGGYYLGQNHPNPFRGQTRISGRTAGPGPAVITVYNCVGQVVRDIQCWVGQSGEFSVLWNGQDNAGRAVASGVYFYALETSVERLCRQIIILD